MRLKIRQRRVEVLRYADQPSGAAKLDADRRLSGRVFGEQFHKLQQRGLRRIRQRLGLRVNQFRHAHRASLSAGCLTCKLGDAVPASKLMQAGCG